jgi:hypothetical protein
MNKITANYETLMRQAPMTIHDYLFAAIKSIDQAFGEGYAKKHPEIVMQFVQEANKETQASCLLQTIQEGIELFHVAVRDAAYEAMISRVSTEIGT